MDNFFILIYNSQRVYPEFNEYAKNKENLLKNTIIKKVIEDFIDYTPKELLDILISVQEI